jgi:hypothetical protein
MLLKTQDKTARHVKGMQMVASQQLHVLTQHVQRMGSNQPTAVSRGTWQHTARHSLLD